jgi:hypothetical protein
MHLRIGPDDLSYPLLSGGSGIFFDSLLGYGRSIFFDETLGDLKTEISLIHWTDFLLAILFELQHYPLHTSMPTVFLLSKGRKSIPDPLPLASHPK